MNSYSTRANQLLLQGQQLVSIQTRVVVLEDVAVRQDCVRLAFEICRMISAALDCDSLRGSQHGAGKQLFKMGEACMIQPGLGGLVVWLLCWRNLWS